MEITADVMVRGQHLAIRWLDGAITAEALVLSRLHRFDAGPWDDPVHFLRAVREAFGDDIQTSVTSPAA